MYEPGFNRGYYVDGEYARDYKKESYGFDSINKKISDEDKIRVIRMRDLENKRELQSMIKEVWDD